MLEKYVTKMIERFQILITVFDRADYRGQMWPKLWYSYIVVRNIKYHDDVVHIAAAYFYLKHCQQRTQIR